MTVGAKGFGTGAPTPIEPFLFKPGRSRKPSGCATLWLLVGLFGVAVSCSAGLSATPSIVILKYSLQVVGGMIANYVFAAVSTQADAKNMLGYKSNEIKVERQGNGDTVCFTAACVCLCVSHTDTVTQNVVCVCVSKKREREKAAAVVLHY